MREGSGLPSGTVTFLFTDIERSTETVAALGDERYADVQDEHRRLLRDAFERHDGVEVGTEGDAFFVAFSRAGAAVQAAVDGQRALEGQPLRVRIGVHTGEAAVREGGYVGHDVHKAKRIEDAGHGGQILLSQSTAELVRDAFDLIDLGPHRLKDLGEPQHLYQVRADGLALEFPPLRSLESFTHNLPLQRSAFIGRELEIAEVRKLLEAHRLVTLTGIGGCGKTRLALQVGAELLDDYPSGVFFVDLAPVSDPEAVPRLVASAVGMPSSALGTTVGAPIADLLLDFLSVRACLVVLDNCEHLLDDSAELVDRILGRCPDVTILSTSREPLDVEGEQAWRVPSLSVAGSVAEAQASEAVSLFKARAQAVQPDFDLQPDNIDAVVEICRRLDGIPLAIEFAASRVSHMSPREIADRLGDMFRLLTGGRRRVQRQQTLQAALDWSFELLSETERTLLTRLAVFSGSFTLDAAEGICSGDGIEPFEVIDLLRSLVEKSLVDTDRSLGATRYRLLEPVRLYAAEKLRSAGGSDDYRGRHRDHYAEWVEAFPLEDAFLAGGTIERIEAELDNLRAAISWSHENDEPDPLARIASRLFGVAYFGGHFDEGLRWYELALTHEGRIDPALLQACLIGLSFCSMVAARGDTAELAARSLEASTEASGPLVIAKSQVALNRSVTAEATGSADLAASARATAAEAIADAGSLRETVWRAFAQIWAANVEIDLLGAERAIPLLEEASRSLDAGRYADLAGFAEVCLAFCRYVSGDTEAALRAARRGDELASGAALLRRAGWQDWPSLALAVALAAAGDATEARLRMREILIGASDIVVPFATNEMLFYAATVLLLTGQPDRASRLLAAGRGRVRATAGVAAGFRSPMGYLVYVDTLRRAREALSADDARRYRDEGRAMSLDEALTHALEGLGDEL